MLTPFSPPPGINSDDTTLAAEGQWADCNCVRFFHGKPQMIGGWRMALYMTTAGLGNVRAIHPFIRGGALVIAYGTESSSGTGAKLAIGATQPGGGTSYVLSMPADRSPPGVSSDTKKWSFGAWGDILLASPSGGTLYEQSGADNATEVTQAPNAITKMLVSPERRQVLAFGCNEEVSGTFNGLCIRWCDFEDYSDWTSSAANNAGEVILSSGGAIVGAAWLGSYPIVWTTNALFWGQFIGDPGQTYRFDLVDEHCGLIAQNAVATLNQRAYWMGPDRMVRTWAPGELPQIIPWPASQDFNANLAYYKVADIVASPVSRFEEIWFHYQDNRPSTPQGVQNNRFVAYSIAESRAAGRPVWFRGEHGRCAIVDSSLLAAATYNIADVPTIIGADNSVVYLHETGTITGGGTTDTVQITSADFSLDNGGRRMMIRGIRPDFEDQIGRLSLSVNVRMHPQSAATVKGPYTLTPATVKKDFRASGNLVSIKLAGDALGDDCHFRLGKLLFDMVPLGER